MSSDGQWIFSSFRIKYEAGAAELGLFFALFFILCKAVSIPPYFCMSLLVTVHVILGVICPSSDGAVKSDCYSLCLYHSGKEQQISPTGA